MQHTYPSSSKKTRSTAINVNGFEQSPFHENWRASSGGSVAEFQGIGEWLHHNVINVHSNFGWSRLLPKIKTMCCSLPFFARAGICQMALWLFESMWLTSWSGFQILSEAASAVQESSLQINRTKIEIGQCQMKNSGITPLIPYLSITSIRSWMLCIMAMFWMPQRQAVTVTVGESSVLQPEQMCHMYHMKVMKTRDP